MAIAEESDVAALDEAIRQNVKQKAPEELVAVEREQLWTTVVGVVTPAERHALSVKCDDATVADCDAVCVGANVRSIDIRCRGGDAELRTIAAWIGVYEGRRRLRVVAQTLELRSQSRVTQLVKACDRRMRRDRVFRERVEQLRAAAA